MKDLGMVDAYAFAVSKGYTGTREEFAELMASYATVAEQAAESAAEAAASASTATTAKTDAISAKDTAVSASATATQTAQTATTKASEAAASASSASTDAAIASTAATTATQAAATATTAATTATEKASEASASASAAATSEANAKAAAQDATESAETLSGSVAQIATNTQDITALKEDFSTIQTSLSVESEVTGSLVKLGANVISATLNTESSLSIIHTGKNLLKYPYQSGSITTNGITFTVNSDGSITATGTATANAIFQLVKDNNRMALKAGRYTYSGIDADSNAVENTNRLILGITDVGEKYDYGTGISFVLNADNTIYLKWVVFNGKTVNTTLHPQIELGSAVTSYEPYIKETLTVDGMESVNLYEGVNVFSAGSDFSVTSYALKTASPIYNLKDYATGDGTTDDTEGINKALTDATGGTLIVPSGTYLFSGTLSIHSGTRVIGCGDLSLFKLANTYSLTSYTWRSDAGGYYQNRYPMIATDANSQGCILENFALIGQTNSFKDENEDGVCIRGSQHIVRNVSVTKVNYFPDSFSSRTCITPCWGIMAFNANRVLIQNCHAHECGYECFGVESSTDITFDGCVSGDGVQTGIQIHRSSNRIHFVNCTVQYVNRTQSSAFTYDADPSTPMDYIYVDNCYICGTMNFVAGGENHIFVNGCTILKGVNCNNQEYRKGLVLRGCKINGRVGTWADEAIISDNVIDVSTGYYMIIHNGNKSLVDNNLGIGSVTDFVINAH